MSSVVPTTGRSPRSAHKGCLPTVPTIAAASGIQPSLAMDCNACAIPCTRCRPGTVLLFLQHLVPIFTLPGDKMFQTWIRSNRQRPPIMHAYADTLRSSRPLEGRLSHKISPRSWKRSTSEAPLAQAAVSVQNPPSGSQTCFPGGWVR